VELSAAIISVTFNPKLVDKIYEDKSQLINFNITADVKSELLGSYYFYVDRPDVADVVGKKFFDITEKDLNNNGSHYEGSFEIKANFLGYSRVEIQKKDNDIEMKKSQLVISVVRDKDLLQKIFIYSVAIVVSLSYINMGCALDTDQVYQVLRRPVAPAIGFFSQYLCMPLVCSCTYLLFNSTNSFVFF